MLREALEISSPLPLISGEVPRYHGGSLWHTTPVSVVLEEVHNVSQYLLRWQATILKTVITIISNNRQYLLIFDGKRN